MFDDDFGRPSPATQPLPPHTADEIERGAALSSALETMLSGADAESMLVSGLIDHHLVMTARATRAATFLQVYGLGDVLQFILTMRRYQTRPAQLTKALDSVALKKFMGQLSVNLGK